MLEKDLVRKMAKRIAEKYPEAFTYKTHGNSFQSAGIPDIVGCINGRFIGVEVKLPGKEKSLTKLQQHTINLINIAGGIAFMSSDVDFTMNELERRLSGK